MKLGVRQPELIVSFRKRLGDTLVDVNFQAEAGLTVLFGHSGAGKSVTLRAIAGLIRPDSGTIQFGDALLYDSATRVSVAPHLRPLSYVPQNFGLFPHMTVRENVAFSMPRVRGVVLDSRVAELAGLLGLDGLLDRLPRQLSGGQQQRVALARALAPEPRLLLLDEPFSALDATIRTALRRELVRLKQRLGLTVVFVTHDLREAYQLADRLVVYDNGRVLQSGPREEVYTRPVSRRVADLIEFRNILSATVTGRGAGGSLCLDSQGVLLRALGNATPGEAVDLCIRPEQIILSRRPPDVSTGDAYIEARIVEETAHGSSHTLLFQATEGPLQIEVDVPAHPYEVLGVAQRKDWWLQLRRESLHVMPKEG
jgi:molybdenum ABC transporter ATP-binding protein